MRSRRRRRSSRWDTWETRATVLGVARTLTSATRLLDVLPLLRPDDIEIYLTIDPGSAFDAGLVDYLASLGPTVLPWREARRRRFDLAVACTVHRSMWHLDAPLMVLPHGAGYNRLIAESTGNTVSAVGLSRRELTRFGRVIPRIIGVSHEEQIGRLARSCPAAVSRALLVGDPCFDRMERSLSLRDEYRRALGVVGGRRLVVVNSTWSEHSLIGTCEDLPLRLVRALPTDEFAVAVVLHPNVWARHGTARVLGRLVSAMDAGLLVIPPEQGWQATLVAADCVVGDHGSTTFYGAALDRATAVLGSGEEELDPASPTAAFVRAAPRLDPDGDLYQQLRQALDQHVPGSLSHLTDRTLGARGEAARILQREMYRLLPDHVRAPEEAPRPEPLPAPEPRRSASARRTATFDIEGQVVDGVVEVRRFPVLPGHQGTRGFFAVTTEETNLLWLQTAEVSVRATPHTAVPPERWVAEEAARLPGVTVTVAALGHGRHLVRLRDGRAWEAAAERAWGEAELELDPVVLGCAVNVWLTSGGAAADLGQGLTVRTGAEETRVRLRPQP
ncbi:MAG: hypothetical protein HOY76_27185 [Streptomyces sp.]|nr:hypothetical protein [Streptomyces sp.]NUS87325.1 hypothetical protein [Streptomyces sp.]